LSANAGLVSFIVVSLIISVLGEAQEYKRIARIRNTNVFRINRK